MPSGGGRSNDLKSPMRSPVTPSQQSAAGRRLFERAKSAERIVGSQALLSPVPVAIDMPSPSFDPLLEQFLRPLDPGTMCACVLERAARGKAFRMLVEEGNVPLLIAERRRSDFVVSSADGSHVATLHRPKRGVFILRRSAGAVTDAELAAIVLGEREVPDAPSRPSLNHLRLACGQWVPPADTLTAAMSSLGPLGLGLG